LALTIPRDENGSVFLIGGLQRLSAHRNAAATFQPVEPGEVDGTSVRGRIRHGAEMNAMMTARVEAVPLFTVDGTLTRVLTGWCFFL
jgi:hypothetical protein